MSLEDGLTRREILRYAVAATTQLITHPIPAFAQYRQDAQPDCRYNFSQVKAGLVSSNDYLDERSRCLPEADIARRAGKLGGFLYNPTDAQLEVIFRKMFSKIAKNPRELNSLIQSSINSYSKSKNSTMGLGLLVPGTIDNFGARIPVYTAFLPKLFLAGGVTNDAEMRSIVNHELKHIEDWYSGITLSGIYLSRKTIAPSTMRIEFLENLMELRALYKELEDIFKERMAKRTVSVSQQWIGSRGAAYSRYWESIKSPTTDLEKAVRDTQFDDFKGIIPERSDNIVTIKFNLNGNQYSAVIQLTK